MKIIGIIIAIGVIVWGIIAVSDWDGETKDDKKDDNGQ